MIPIVTDPRELPERYRAFVSERCEPSESELEACREKYQAVYDSEPGEVVFFKSPDGLLRYYVFEIGGLK